MSTKQPPGLFLLKLPLIVLKKMCVNDILVQLVFQLYGNNCEFIIYFLTSSFARLQIFWQIGSTCILSDLCLYNLIC